MAKPAGLIAKTKDNSRKKYRAHSEWNIGKRLGRPKQRWNTETKTWEKA